MHRQTSEPSLSQNNPNPNAPSRPTMNRANSFNLQSRSGGSTGPGLARSSSSASRRGRFTRTLFGLDDGDNGKNGDNISPTSIRTLLNPLRSTLGLGPISLFQRLQEIDAEDEEEEAILKQNVSKTEPFLKSSTTTTPPDQTVQKETTRSEPGTKANAVSKIIPSRLELKPPVPLTQTKVPVPVQHQISPPLLQQIKLELPEVRPQNASTTGAGAEIKIESKSARHSSGYFSKPDSAFVSFDLDYDYRDRQQKSISSKSPTPNNSESHPQIKGKSEPFTPDCKAALQNTHKQSEVPLTLNSWRAHQQSLLMKTTGSSSGSSSSDLEVSSNMNMTPGPRPPKPYGLVGFKTPCSSTSGAGGFGNGPSEVRQAVNPAPSQPQLQSADWKVPQFLNHHTPYQNQPETKFNVHESSFPNPNQSITPSNGNGVIYRARSLTPFDRKSKSTANLPAIIEGGTPEPVAGDIKENHQPENFQVPNPKTSLTRNKNPITKLKKKSGVAGWGFVTDHIAGKEYLMLETLGKGGGGIVTKVKERESRTDFALKLVDLSGLDESAIKECIHEINMLRELKGSGFVIEIHEWEHNPQANTIKIIMEIGEIDLHHFIHKRKLSLEDVWYLWGKMLLIVEFIHSKGIVHSDLKPPNFLFVKARLKLIDFGISNKIQNDATSIAMANPKGTLNFISPETINQDAFGKTKIGPKSDIWSLGCILHLMVFGHTPFHHITNNSTKICSILKGVQSYPELPDQFKNTEILDVLKQCFQLNSRNRPTATALLEHPFLKKH